MNKNFKLTKLEKSWILYDVGNSAFTLLVSTVLPIYFNYLGESAGLSSTEYLSYWGYAVSACTIIVAISGPLLGALSDRGMYKKTFLLSSVLCGVLATLGLGFTSSWIVFLALFMFAKVTYALSLIFCDSMLIDVTTEERMDKVSTYGFAFGYIGSCIPFVIGLVFVLFYESFGLSFNMGMLIAFVVNAAWWFIFTLPVVKNYKQKHVTKEKNINGLAKFIDTLKDIRKDKKVMFFLIAFFFYIDGVYTIIDMATPYGTALGLDSTGLLLALLVTQLVAFPFAILFGRLSQKFDSAKLIQVCILAYTAIGVYAIFLSSLAQFWILAVLVGMFQGGIQALSRSYFGKIIPEEKAGEYYGIMDVCGKGAAFLGTMLVSLGTQITGELSMGISIIAPLIFVGYLFFRKSISYKNK